MYLVASIILGYFPVNRSFQQEKNGIEIYIVSNGVHTDFVFPIENEIIDWAKLFRPEDFQTGWNKASHIAFGWGDKGFYLNTPEWKDLTLRTAIIAVLMPSESAMHVTLWNKPSRSDNVRKLNVDKNTYDELISFITGSFRLNENGKSIPIDHPGYSSYDRFYESDRYFHLFNTCNVWTNRGLQKAEISSGIWSPFDKPILFHLSGF